MMPLSSVAAVAFIGTVFWVASPEAATALAAAQHRWSPLAIGLVGAPASRWPPTGANRPNDLGYPLINVKSSSVTVPLVVDAPTSQVPLVTAMPVSDSLVKDEPPLTEMLWSAPPNPLA